MNHLKFTITQIAVAWLFIPIITNAEISLNCNLEIVNSGLLKSGKIRAEAELTVITSKNGIFWTENINGKQEIHQDQTYNLFEIDHPDFSFKFSSLPNNGTSNVTNKSTNSVWSYTKTTEYKNGAKAEKSLYINRNTGEFRATTINYLKMGGHVASEQIISGACEKPKNQKKF